MSSVECLVEWTVDVSAESWGVLSDESMAAWMAGVMAGGLAGRLGIWWVDELVDEWADQWVDWMVCPLVDE